MPRACGAALFDTCCTSDTTPSWAPRGPLRVVDDVCVIFFSIFFFFLQMVRGKKKKDDNVSIFRRPQDRAGGDEINQVEEIVETK